MGGYRAYHKAVKAGLVVSGHDLSEGGLAVAVAESCIAGSIGACIDLDLIDESEFLSDQELLFSESSGRILVSVNPDLETGFLGYLKGVTTQKIGAVTSKNRLLVNGKAKKRLIDVSISELTDAFKNPLYPVLGMQV